MEREKNAKLKIWDKGIKPKGLFTISALNEMCKIEDDP